jgi:hypothetical protein
MPELGDIWLVADISSRDPKPSEMREEHGWENVEMRIRRGENLKIRRNARTSNIRTELQRGKLRKVGKAKSGPCQILFSAGVKGVWAQISRSNLERERKGTY